MGNLSHYVIRGGVEGRERLRLLARVMAPGTEALLTRVGLREGMRCLDVGCGGGDVSLQLAHRVGPRGRVVGIDLDETKIAMARAEAQNLALEQVTFLASDVREQTGDASFDVVYSRFLLTHLPDPAEIVARLVGWLRPGGALVLEDIDVNGQFVYPASPAFNRYCELYREAVRQRGGDADIGPKLPVLAKRAGLVDVTASVTQPIGLESDVKLLSPLTMENIADAVVQASLASREEIDTIVREMYAFAADPETLGGTPRIVQVHARRP